VSPSTRPVDDRRDRTAGVTLVELLIAVTLLGVIMTVLSTTLFMGLRTTRDTRTRLLQSTGEQLATTWLTRDIGHASTVLVNSSDTSCGGATPLKVRYRSDALATSADNTASYALVSGNLVRRDCVPTSATPVTMTIARGITSFTPAACTTTCTVTVVAAGSATDSSIGSYTYSLKVYRRGG
jgi:prepilin-type N-terminal cleavage/methylation domain-containing protein